MGMTNELLDKIAVVPGMLHSSVWDRAATPATSLTLHSNDGSRQIRLGLPWVVRHPSAGRLGAHWETFCGLVRAFEIGLQCSVHDLESVPAVSVPLRFGRNHAGASLDPIELQTADVFELDGRTLDSQHWHWPADSNDPQRMEAMLGAIRNATSGDTPIGLALPLGARDEDLQRCLEAGADFLTLVSFNRSRADSLAISGIVRARKSCVAAGFPEFPLIVDVPVCRPKHLIIYLALGASIVSVDSLLAQAIELDVAKSTQVGSGMLSGIGATMPTEKSDLPHVKGVLSDLRTELVEQMSFLGVADISQLNRQCLRTANAEVAGLAGLDLWNV